MPQLLKFALVSFSQQRSINVVLLKITFTVFQDLTAMIKTCLEKAEAEKLTSIAFPTLGCGDLRYNQADVSRCFSEAAKGSLLQVLTQN